MVKRGGARRRRRGGQRGGNHGGDDEAMAMTILTSRPDEPSPLDLSSLATPSSRLATTALCCSPTSHRHQIWRALSVPRRARSGESRSSSRR
ncbi:Os06g0631425 [Oryza sativa Japonica Group]|uniref:Os06g0631425 protein n=1 Tax=Oryza sativa subsp. japonica TaxID=39947 RepID=A0A0N7KMG2_ORYSJ|nr:Os06g0631425 [Oryza sativa Japonica Group]